jgi:peptidoglycan biosynthesis protein MviN/MurJ (putative lipid II flippase)
MLTDEEEKFIAWWEQNRDKQKKFFRQLAIGLPAGVIFGLAIFISLASGWYKRAMMTLNAGPSVKSLVLVLIIALLLIVVFISVFSVKMKWERYEQRYRELLSKRRK